MEVQQDAETSRRVADFLSALSGKLNGKRAGEAFRDVQESLREAMLHMTFSPDPENEVLARNAVIDELRDVCVQRGRGESVPPEELLSRLVVCVRAAFGFEVQTSAAAAIMRADQHAKRLPRKVS